jgi:hypothetical protein
MSDPVRAYQALYGIASRLSREYLTNPYASYASDMLGTILQKIGSIIGNGIGSLKEAKNAIGNKYVTAFTKTENMNIGKLLGSREIIFDLDNCAICYNKYKSDSK